MTSELEGTRVHSRAPGRVNLIGEHTDYTGGLVLPIAIQHGTTIDATFRSGRVELTSDRRRDVVAFDLPVREPRAIGPAWGRYVAGAAAELANGSGLTGTVRSDLTIGGGLSSSSSLTVAAMLALGSSAGALDLALACRRAETRATGVVSGLMDQLVIAAAIEHHALLIDCATNATTPIAVPDDLEIAVVDSGQHRSVATSAYATRTAECAAAAAVVGPLRDATPADLDAIEDETVRRRARHVVTENARVLDFVDALATDDRRVAGSLLAESHRSLRDDFEVSTPQLDALVTRLGATRGVYGARLTGAGFGGCVVALCEPGTTIDGAFVVRPSAGATVERS